MQNCCFVYCTGTNTFLACTVEGVIVSNHLKWLLAGLCLPTCKVVRVLPADSQVTCVLLCR